jgi:hypothetical protein
LVGILLILYYFSCRFHFWFLDRFEISIVEYLLRCQTWIMGRKDQDKMIYHHTFKDLNPRIHILFMLRSSFEQPITERDVNSCENASNIQIIDEGIGSSGDQSEINEFSP